MSDMLAAGLAWLTQQLTEFASQTVVYARGANQVSVPATFGAKLLKLQGPDGGIRMQWTDMDFLIASAYLNFNGQPIIPQRGDFIYITQPPVVQCFEVLPYLDEAPWRWSDPHRTMLRIHTKHVDTQPLFQ